LQTACADMATPERPLLFSERGGGLSPARGCTVKCV